MLALGLVLLLGTCKTRLAVHPIHVGYVIALKSEIGLTSQIKSKHYHYRK